jgi:nitrous oxidase accessory protein NosD
MEVYRNSRVYKNLRTPYYLISVRISMKRSVAAAIVGIVFVLMLLPSNIQLQTSNASSLKIVPSDYPSIQSAIDAASPGDTIKVLPGTYNEQLTISKSLTLVGTGSEITIIKAPANLPNTNTNGDPYIVDLKNGATVNIKGLTVSGPSLASCPQDLIGISVMSGATLNLNFASIEDCTYKGIFAEGDAIVKWTTVTDYRDHGIFGFGEDSTIKVSYSSTVAAQNSVIPGEIGVLLDGGANGVIDHNKVSLNSVAGAVAKLTTTP